MNIIEQMADAIDGARYAHPEHPRERPRPFAEADRSDREYAMRLARAAGRAAEIEQLEAKVTAWRQAFESIEAHLMDRINMGDPARPEVYLSIIRSEVANINRSSEAIVNARWADHACANSQIERLTKLLNGIAEYCSGDDRTLGAIERLATIRNTVDRALGAPGEGSER